MVHGLDLCSQDGYPLLQIPATPEMLENSAGYQQLAQTWTRIKGIPVPLDQVRVAMCTYPGCSNTYVWVNGDYPRIEVERLEDDGDGDG